MLATVALVLDRRKIKMHFTFTYINFCCLIFFVSALVGLFSHNYYYYEGPDTRAVYLLLIVGGAAFAWYMARYKKSFLFLLYAFIAIYIAFTYVLVEFVFDDVVFWFMYSIASCGGFIYFIIKFRNHFTRERVSFAYNPTDLYHLCGNQRSKALVQAGHDLAGTVREHQVGIYKSILSSQLYCPDSALRRILAWTGRGNGNYASTPVRYKHSSPLLLAFSIMYGVSSFVMLDRFFITNHDHYKSGLTEALLYHSCLFTIAGVCGHQRS